jgi:hypothetical protein
MPCWCNMCWRVGTSVSFRAGPTLSSKRFIIRVLCIFRVAKQDFWGDPAYPVFTACGTDPYYGSQCEAGRSSGSSSNVSLCSEVLRTDTVVCVSIIVLCVTLVVSSVVEGGSVKTATKVTTRSLAAATLARKFKVPPWRC